MNTNLTGAEKATLIVMGLLCGGFFLLTTSTGQPVVGWLALIAFVLVSVLIHANANSRTKK